MVSECNGFKENDEDKQTCKKNLKWVILEVPRKRYFLEKFYLFETRLNFYLVGREKSKTYWRVLKIDRSEPLELVLHEDPAVYSWKECFRLLKRIEDGNRHDGGLKFVTVCYGIVGVTKFVGPYYMVLITKRTEVGEVCGHPIYAISKYRLIQVPHKSVEPGVKSQSEENRYKKLLCTLDFTNYFFSYSYALTHSLQKNLCSDEAASGSNGSAFNWNEFLTHEIRKRLGNTLWTVALIHGFFKQVNLSSSDSKFSLTLIARRSRLHAGPRYLKRGLNEEGQAANYVEIEQIVCGKIRGGFPYKITSMVQNRGSIPLIWCQHASWTNLKPDIILLEANENYKATNLHFEDLRKRYGDPIVILNLLKCCESSSRECVLGQEFHNAVVSVNTSLPDKNQLKLISFDLDGFFKAAGTPVLDLLKEEVVEAVKCIGFLSYEVVPSMTILQTVNMSNSLDLNRDAGNLDNSLVSVDDIEKSAEDNQNEIRECNLDNSLVSVEDIEKSAEDNQNEIRECRRNNNLCEHHSVKPQEIQSGVLRANCVDCLDRTNVGQFVYGLAALGYQLRELGIITSTEVKPLDESLVDITMEVYKDCGHVLAWQYGGSGSRCKILSAKKGEWKPIIQLKEFIKTLQRYFSNVCMDARKQKAVDLFLGYLRPGKDQLEMLESMPCQDHISSSSQSNCFLCEGMSYKTPANSIFGSNSEHQKATNPTMEPSKSKIFNGEVSVAATSESDTLGNRHPSEIYELQLQAYTDIEEWLWFRRVCMT